MAAENIAKTIDVGSTTTRRIRNASCTLPRGRNAGIRSSANSVINPIETKLML